MVRLFGRQTCQYILANLSLEKAKEPKNNDADMDIDREDNHNLPEMASALVEKIIKVYKQLHKVHRNKKTAIMRSQN